MKKIAGAVHRVDPKHEVRQGEEVRQAQLRPDGYSAVDETIHSVPTPPAAATKIQAAFRGRQVRKKVVMPSEIEKFITTQLTALTNTEGLPVNPRDLAKALAREVLDFSNKNPKYAGHGIRLFERGGNYSFPVFNGKNEHIGADTIELPVGVWVKKTDKGLEIELIGKKLGEGVVKQVFDSYPVQIDLTSEQHAMSAENMVLLTAKPGQTAVFLEGMRAVDRIFPAEERAGDPNLRLAGMLEKTDRRVGGDLEASNTRFRGDLTQVNAELTTAQRLQVLQDEAYNLSRFHAKGAVHFDVKPDNILVSKGEPHGYAADFDVSSEKMKFRFPSRHDYRDATARELGMVTPLADIYGLAKTAAVTLFGANKDERDANVFKKIANQAMMKQVENTLQTNGINYALVKDTPDDALAQLQDDMPMMSLTSPQRTALTGLIASTEVLMKQRDNIAAVYDADAKTAERISDPRYQFDEGSAEDAYKSLEERFPAFKNFMEGLLSVNMSSVNHNLSPSPPASDFVTQAIELHGNDKKIEERFFELSEELDELEQKVQDQLESGSPIDKDLVSALERKWYEKQGVSIELGKTDIARLENDLNTPSSEYEGLLERLKTEVDYDREALKTSENIPGVNPATRNLFIDTKEALQTTVLGLRRLARLHEMWRIPVEESAQKMADEVSAMASGYAYEMPISRLDVITPNSDEGGRFEEFQKSRMGGSTTITNTNKSGDESARAKANWLDTDRFVREQAQRKRDYSAQEIEDLIKSIHARMGDGLHNNGFDTGKYRELYLDTQASGNTEKIYVAGRDVQKEMARFGEWLSDGLKQADKGLINPILLASQAYQKLVSIHPFSDANGRATRMLMDFILQRYGILPATLDNINLAQYGEMDPSRNLTVSDGAREVVQGVVNAYEMMGLTLSNT